MGGDGLLIWSRFVLEKSFGMHWLVLALLGAERRGRLRLNRGTRWAARHGVGRRKSGGGCRPVRWLAVCTNRASAALQVKNWAACGVESVGFLWSPARPLGQRGLGRWGCGRCARLRGTGWRGQGSPATVLAPGGPGYDGRLISVFDLAFALTGDRTIQDSYTELLHTVF